MNADRTRAMAARLQAQRNDDLSLLEDVYAGARPEPCKTCRGDGWVVAIDADPLPSGEPGEPYQVQQECPDCGGAGVLPRRERLDVPRVAQAVANIAKRHGIIKDPALPLAVMRIFGYSTAPAVMEAEIADEYARLGGDHG